MRRTFKWRAGGAPTRAIPHDEFLNGRSTRINIKALNIWVTPLTAEQVVSVVANTQGKRLLLNHNLHSAYLHDTDEAFRRLYQTADWVVIDGTPIRWLASLSIKARVGPEYRIGSTDWVARLQDTGSALRLFVYGASPQSNEAAIRSLTDRMPGWSVSGINGYVEPNLAIEKLHAFQPDIVLVGLGMPMQEKFLLDNLTTLPQALYATVGGAIDYIAGTTNLSPRWLGGLGLEWTWRLANQPRRLAYRYSIEPVKLAWRTARRSFETSTR